MEDKVDKLIKVLDGYNGIAEKFIAEEEKVEKLTKALEDYNKVAEKFIAKVDSGRARSVETYMELMLCLENAKKALEGETDINDSRDRP